jgi:hypothetical protein
MCKEFPKHIGLTMLDCVLPCLVGCIPVFLSGVYMRNVQSEVPWYIGRTVDMQNETYNVLSNGLYVLNIIMVFGSRLAIELRT